MRNKVLEKIKNIIKSSDSNILSLKSRLVDLKLAKASFRDKRSYKGPEYSVLEDHVNREIKRIKKELKKNLKKKQSLNAKLRELYGRNGNASDYLLIYLRNILDLLDRKFKTFSGKSTQLGDDDISSFILLQHLRGEGDFDLSDAAMSYMNHKIRNVAHVKSRYARVMIRSSMRA